MAAKGEKAEPEVITQSTTLTTVAVVVSVVIIAAYLIGLVLQWQRIDVEDLPWARGLDLLGGLEALAFAAAGALFGTTVQRQVTEKVEKQAASQKRRADANESAAEGARAVANLARIKAEGASQASSGPARRSIDRDARSAPAGSDLDEIVALAARYGIGD